MRDEENEMLERVAQAVYNEMILIHGIGTPMTKEIFGNCADPKEFFDRIARAAIEAMLEPSEAMIDAAYTCDPEDGVYVEYQAMIDAALSE